MQDINNLFNQNLPTPIQKIEVPVFLNYDIQLFLKRDDLIHPEISGNKWRKLKHNLIEAKNQQFKTILTFGGAYSNHIAATAAACKMVGINSIGIIRGEELNKNDNPTLRKAAADGMQLVFVTREDYRKKNNPDYIKTLKNKLGDFFIIPEGGANELGVKGCTEIIDEVKEHFDFICVACGTGTTMTGIISGANSHQKILGFPALKGGTFLEQEVLKLLDDNSKENKNWQLQTAYHFGGYAKHTDELLLFIKEFKAKHAIELDFIYTGKMMFGIYDCIKNGGFPRDSNILAIHTGGLQGNKSIPELFA